MLHVLLIGCEICSKPTREIMKVYVPVCVSVSLSVWQFESSKADVSAALVEVLEELTEEEKARMLIPNFDIVDKSEDRVHVLTWTKIEWLDSLGISYILRHYSKTFIISAYTIYHMVRHL